MLKQDKSVGIKCSCIMNVVCWSLVKFSDIKYSSHDGTANAHTVHVVHGLEHATIRVDYARVSEEWKENA